MTIMRLAFHCLAVCLCALLDSEVLKAADTPSGVDSGLRRMLEDPGTYDIMSTNAPAEWCQQIVTYYQAHAKDLPIKAKLPVSRCMAQLDRYEDAARVASEYVTVYSNDWRGWRILGSAKVIMKDYDSAFAALSKAAELGDDENLWALGTVGLMTDHIAVVSNTVVPRLMVLKDSARFPADERLTMRNVLVVYSSRVGSEETFLKAVRGVKLDDIVSREDLLSNIKNACATFHSPESEKFCRDITQALEAKKKLTN